MADTQKIQDDITLVLQAQKIIVHDTVRVNVSISAQVDPEQSEADFRGEINWTLRQFIETDWKIQSIQRSKGNKYEVVNVNATARVPETENYKLEERASAVSRIGFELVYPKVDYSLSFDEVQAVNQELRLTLLRQALTECTAINGEFRDAKHPAGYRLSSTRFDLGNSDTNNVIRAQAYNMATASPMGSGNAGNHALMSEDAAEDEGSTDLNVSTRFSMTGTFVLRFLYA